jgi:hypothetical protein
MATSASHVETLVMRVQDDFLTTPALRLTLPEAERRFGLNRRSCAVLLDLLVDANVLARTADGAYERFFPRLAHAA